MFDRIACAAAAVLVAGSFAQNAPKSAQEGPKKPQTPYEAEKARIELEIQGTWEVTGFQSLEPEFQNVTRASGYMSVQDGWITMTTVITTFDNIVNLYAYYFVSTAKQYSITSTNRLHLTDVWGYQVISKGPAHDLKPYVAGAEEDRVLLFQGPPQIGQKLRVQRGPNDWVEFLRRTPPAKPPATPTVQDR
ncbi:MAG TPA: hypothetical protein VKE69_09965 [Planctomycetota bacterium]|nr:hypothetical protein [Planctomycetota bacterium]